MYEIYLTETTEADAHPNRVADLLDWEGAAAEAADICTALQPYLRDGVEAHFALQDDASLGDGLPTILASLRYDAARFYQGSYNNPTNPSWATVSGPLPAQNWGSLTWRGSARQRLGDDLSAYLSYSQGFRQPNLEDMVETLLKGKGSTQFLMLANPNLRPERVDTYELGADYTPWPVSSSLPACIIPGRATSSIPSTPTRPPRGSAAASAEASPASTRART